MTKKLHFTQNFAKIYLICYNKLKQKDSNVEIKEKSWYNYYNK